MSLYGVGFKIEGNLQLNETSRDYTVDGHKVTLIPVPDEQHAATAIVEMEAGRGIDAFTKAHDYADKLLDAISFTMSISLYIPGMSVVLKGQPGATRREALTLSYRPMNRALWLNDTNDASTRTILSLSTNLTLSLRWLRLAYRARSSIEQFTNYWLALETFTGSHQVVNTCPNCGETMGSYDTTNMPQIKDYIRQYNSQLSSTDLNKIIRLRHKLFHGGAGFTLSSSADANKWRLVIKHTVLELLKASTGIDPLDIDTPNTPNEATRIFSRVAFDTITPSNAIALDFPTEKQILAEFNASSSNTNGFEFLEMPDGFVDSF